MILPRILIIEKDSTVLVTVKEAILEAGYEVVVADNGEQMLKLLNETRINIILLDTSISGAHGEAVFTNIRQATDLPVIVWGDKKEAFEALESGADAFMVKPPHLRELLARVKNLLRRTMRTHDGSGGLGSDFKPSKFDDSEYDPLENKLQNNHQLSINEVRLASCLVKNKGELVRYSKIIDEVWGGKKVTTDLIHFYVRRLRIKLQSVSPRKVLLVNVRGLGYRLEFVV